jgi:hypothetical protein
LKERDKWYTPRVGYLLRGVRAQRTRLEGWYFAVFCGVLAMLVQVGSAHAQGPALTLRWQAPRGCPDADSVQARVLALIGEGQAHASTALLAHATITQLRARYQLSLSLEQAGHRAVRVLRAAQCAELADTAAWLIALTVNPAIEQSQGAAPSAQSNAPAASTGSGADRPGVAVERERVAPRTPAAEQAKAVSAGRAAVATPVADPERSASPSQGGQNSGGSPPPEAPSRYGTSRRPAPRSLSLGVLAGLFLGAASVVQASVGAHAGVGVGWSYSQLRLSGLLPREFDVTGGGSARLWSLSLDLTQCALWGDAVRAGPCLGLSGLRTRADVRGLASATDRVGYWGIATAGLQLFWRLPRRLALVVSGAVGVPVSRRPRFVVEGLGTLAAARAWSLDARLGLAFAGL